LESSSSSLPDTTEYVGFWKRFIAFLIDTLVILVITVPLVLAVYGTDYAARSDGMPFAGTWDFLIQVVLPAAAVILFWRYRGATPGKMAISAKIVDAQTGKAPATARLVVRYFAYLISTLPLFLGFLWIAVDRRKQGFHDKIAGTVVVYDDE
jgi:uncharacterized RDD family membrane protein YckC